MDGIFKILCIEDNLHDAELIWREIGKDGLQFSHELVDNQDDYLKALQSLSPDIIISDFSLPDFDGLTALSIRNKISPLTPFILVTGSVNEEVAVECMKSGADDYILKNNMARLLPAINNAVKKLKLTHDRKTARDDLFRSERRLQKAQAIAHVGNWELDLSSKMIWCSDEARNLYGLETSTNEILYETIKKIPLPEYRAMLDDTMNRLLKYNEQYEAEFRIRRMNDGAIRTIYSKAELVKEPESDQIKVIGVIQDITDKKQAEEAIILERRTLRTLIDNIPDAIYVKDEKFRKVIANKADLDNLGLSNEAEALGKTDLELFPFNAGEAGYLEDKEVIETGRSLINSEQDFVDRNGNSRWLRTSKIPLHDNDGKVTGLVGIGHDITERKENEIELIRARDKAEESDKLKTAFLHNISHEIRTPMNAIVGFSALLGEPGIDENSRKSYIEVIMQSSNHLLSIITDIVDISNIEANLIKTIKNEINLNQTIKSLCNQFFPKAYEKNITLDYVTTLPDSEVLIVSDRTKLLQVLTNLISNSLKFTDKGFVRITYKLKDEFLEFSVSDSGIGIPVQYHERVFDRFFQVQSNVSRLYEGTGLGLAISKAYVELMGGKIWVSSGSEIGTTISFTIPYDKMIIPSVPVSERKSPDVYIFPEKRVILVAEDIESNFKLIRYFLSNSNTEVIHAFNGQEAVEKCLSNENIDLVLMDIKMPVMDGYTAVRLIREKNTSIPIIAQTAYADDRERAIECGCSGFISKPFDKKGLFKVLCEFI